MTAPIDSPRQPGHNPAVAECKTCGKQAALWESECFGCKSDRLQRDKWQAKCPDCGKVTRVLVSTEDGETVWNCACGVRFARRGGRG